MWILDPTAPDVQALDDHQLVELVTRLCRMEAKALGLPATAVTQGGKDSEGDGGIDVRVEGRMAKAGALVRLPAGLQIKARTMPRAKIIEEMTPHGALRPSITAVLEAGGVYILASGKEDLADGRRQHLTEIMRGLVGASHRDRVHIYDSRQLAAWSCAHPGVAAWLREQAGRPLDGWHAWGSWSAPDQPADLPYLLDDEARVFEPMVDPDRAHSMTTGLGLVREALGKEGAIVRLTGLSGMGKTRFAQALFDTRVGSAALPAEQVVYGDAGFEKAVSPGQLARSLVQDQVEAILIVDNCSARHHRELTTIARSRGSRLRLLTIDFDVGDDQPEHTDVFSLQSASGDLIDSLLIQRAPDLTAADRRRIVTFAGGNTRIALAIAFAPRGPKGIAQLRNDELLDRLFLKDRREADADLRRVARVAALVNAFSVTGDEAEEAGALTALAGVSELVFHEKMSELLDRGLAQKRGHQRAILPQAIAAWLAAEALKALPDTLLQNAFDGFPLRLQKSFARRLGMLQDVPQATALAERLLSPGGRFATPSDDNGQEVRAVHHLAPLAPDLALDVADGLIARGLGLESWRPERRELRILLVALAYDPARFDRAVDLLARLAVGETDRQRNYDSVREKLLPLFQVKWSGAHASPMQRFAAIDRWMASEDDGWRALGLSALDRALETQITAADMQIDFGSEVRDSGWFPQNAAQVRDWYDEGLARVRTLLTSDQAAARKLIRAHYPSLAGLSVAAPGAVATMRAAASGAFWPEGWYAACKGVWRLRKKKRPRPIQVLEQEMRPATLEDDLEVWLTLDWHEWRNPDHADHARNDWPEARRRALAASIAAADQDALVIRILGDRRYGGGVLGECLAQTSAENYRRGWERLKRLGAHAPVETLNSTVFVGYLFEVRAQAPELAEVLLDEVVVDAALKSVAVQICLGLGRTDDRALDRILTLLRDPEIDAERRRTLWLLRFEDTISDDRAAELIDALVQCGETDQAIHLLWMRDREPDWSGPLRMAAAGALVHADVVRTSAQGRGDWDRRMARIAERALVGPEGAAFAQQLLERLTAIGEEFYSTRKALPERLTKAIFTVQPRLALDAFLPCLNDDRRYAVRSLVTEHDDDDRPARSVFNRVPEPVLRDWLAEDPCPRSRILAEYGSYFRHGPDRTFQWTPLVEMVIEIADPEALERIAERFETGMSSGGWAERYRRRRPPFEALQNHANPRVRAWAADIVIFIDEQIEARRAWDRQPPERFE